MSEYSDRIKLLTTYRDAARRADQRNDVVARTQHSDGWLYFATQSDIARAPKYLTWTGRK